MPTLPRLKRRYGQHHLLHAELCRPLLAFLQPQGRRVVEIGPGGGVLTGELLRVGARVTAWEIDPEWAFSLRHRLPASELDLVVGDALELDWSRLPAGCLVAGNLPYGVATRLILDLLVEGGGVPRAGFLVQWEVACRLAARAGDADYGGLSVLVQALAELVQLGRVRRGSFRPPPKVDGAFVGLRRKLPGPEPGQWSGFATLVRLAFGQRRKSLRNALAAGWGRRRADELLAAAGLPPGVRATELGLDAFIDLYRRARRQRLLDDHGC